MALKMSILETANYLENLRRLLAETAALNAILAAQLTKGSVTLVRDRRQGWSAEFSGIVKSDGGHVMPAGEPIPLPFGPSATAETVARDMAERFPGAAIVVCI